MLSAPRTTKETVLARRKFARSDHTRSLQFFQLTAINLSASGSSLDRSKTGGFDKFFQRFDQTDDARQIFRPCAPFVFMPAAKQNRVGMQRRFDVEQPRALRPVKFVGADGNQVRVELADVFKRLLAKPLDRIRVKNNSALAANRAQFRDRLDCADFIVRRHDRNQNRVRADGLLQIFRRNAAFRIHRQPRDFKTFLFFKVIEAIAAPRDARWRK